MVIGYMWCIIGYISLNMVQSHTPGIYRTRSFIPEETERTGGYFAFSCSLSGINYIDGN